MQFAIHSTGKLFVSFLFILPICNILIQKRCTKNPPRYGLSAGIRGSFDNLSSGVMFWDLTVIMHELGHNFGSRHTHDDVGYSVST